MAWLLAYCSSRLRAIEQIALDLPSVQRARITTGNGEQFQPHFTLAIWDGSPGAVDVALPEEIAAEPRFDGRLALGRIGPNGVYEESFFEA